MPRNNVSVLYWISRCDVRQLDLNYNEIGTKARKN